MTRFVGTPLRGIEFATAGDEAVSVRVLGDVHARLRIDAGGRLTWSSGDESGDVTLQRDGANTLKTDDLFKATAGLVTLATEGPPTAELPDGTLAVDVLNFVFYFRADSEWHALVGNTELDDLTDVTINNPQSGQYLQYDGFEWVNGTSPTNEPTGFTVKSDSIISFDETTRIFTIQPSDSKFDVWCAGINYTFSAPETVTIPNTSGLYYIYFDSAGTLQYKTTYFEFQTDAPVSYVYWNATDEKAYFFADERHGIVLDWQTHEYLHRTRGAAIASGFGAGGFTTTGDGTLDTHAQIDIANGIFFDEDMEISISHSLTPTANTWEQRLEGPAYIPVFRHENTHWVKDEATQFPMKQGTERVQYNINTAGTWSSVDIDQNKFGISWVAATNNLNEPIIAILGQGSYNTQGEADAIGWDSLDLDGFPVYEFRPLYKLTYATATGYANTPHARITGVYDIRRVISGGDQSIPTTPVTDHGSMIGLGDDDHTQYLNTARHDVHDHSLAMSTVDTDDIAEGDTNLYFTDERARASVNADLGGTDGGTRFVAPTSDADVQLISYEATHAVIVQSDGITDAKVIIKGSAEIQASPSISDPGNLTVAGDINITGNLFVSGSTVSLNTETLSVEDNIITLNSGVTGSPVTDAGIEVERGTSPNVELRWNEATDRWQFTNDGVVYTDLGGVKLSETAPTGTTGELWFNTANQSLYVYYDDEWVIISGGGGGGASVLVQDNAPSFGSTGDLWYSSSLGKFFIRYDSYWVEVMSAGPQGPVGPQGPQGETGPTGPQGLPGNIALSSINELADVTISTPLTNQFLRYNGTEWENHPIELGTHTSGDYVDSLVAGTGVTIINNVGAGSTPTVRIGQSVSPTSNPTFGNVTITGNISSNNATISNNLIVTGNLTVQGNSTTLNVETLSVEDNIITLNSGATGEPSVNAGIEILRGTSPTVNVRWNETIDKWEFTNDGVNYIYLGAGGAAIGENPPLIVEPGAIWFDSNTGKAYVYYDSTWVELGNAGGGTSSGGASMTIADTAPLDANAGDLWFDSSTTKTYVYYDAFWVEIGSTGTGALVSGDAPADPVNGQLWFDTTEEVLKVYSVALMDWIVAGGGGGAGGGSMQISGTAPLLPDEGSMWFDSETARTYIYYDGFWVEIGGSAMAATVGDTAPSSPINGQVWFNSATGGTYIYYDSVWVEMGAAPANTILQTINAKGDLLVGTTDNELTRLPVGTNGQILAANSATATGLEWTTPNYASTGKAIAMAIVFGG